MTAGGMTVSENTKQREAVDRRRFLKGAATVAWAAPVIATLSATPAYAACGQQNAPCGTQSSSGACPNNPACCSGYTCRPQGKTDCQCKKND